MNSLCEISWKKGALIHCNKILLHHNNNISKNCTRLISQVRNYYGYNKNINILNGQKYINRKNHRIGIFYENRYNYYTSSDNKKNYKKIWSNLGFIIIPQQTAYIIERLGKYKKTLLGGIHFLLPFIDKVAYVFSLKEETITIPNQTAITKDNVTLNIDGVLYIKCENPYYASYAIDDAIFAVTQLAQVTMRTELGKLTLDTTFLERDNLNEKIVKAINESSKNWGIKCMRYEIRDIILPVNIKNAMEKQAEAERRKRAEILQSEGERESEINIAIGKKKKSILVAEGQAFAIKAKADATAEAIDIIANKIKKLDSHNAIALHIAEQYLRKKITANSIANENASTLMGVANNVNSLNASKKNKTYLNKKYNITSSLDQNKLRLKYDTLNIGNVKPRKLYNNEYYAYIKTSNYMNGSHAYNKTSKNFKVDKHFNNRKYNFKSTYFNDPTAQRNKNLNSFKNVKIEAY
ncbi:stomatin-like protein [Plasmodium ovale curtisi]|uniref:Stomatin-like protein n=1 Tax=Plasmodium ovale curtisi TaxID=864141 RepID=A0A1A8WJQ1_PLAOA|nr:stomatin-like protein [Plasmodium ovale curtisi]